MKPTEMLSLLIIITVCASFVPLEAVDTTTLSSSDLNKIVYTLPSITSSNNSNNSKPKPNENRLEITLKMDENDKEVIDNDMGKYLH
jgi:hypothetical protein